MRLGAIALWLILATLMLLPKQAAAAAASGKSTGGSIPVKVTFTGKGAFTIDETYLSSDDICTVQTHDTMPLAWSASYLTVIDNVAGAGNGSLSSAQGQLDSGPGTLSLTSQSFGDETACSEVAPLGFPPCSSSIPHAGPAPALKISSGTRAKQISFAAQSLTSIGSFSGCGGIARGVDVARDLSVLESILPEALSAKGTIPADGLDSSAPYTAKVSSEAVTSGAGSCITSGHYAAGTTECAWALSWSGAVTFTPECHRPGAPASNPAMPDCLDPHHKKQAQDAFNYDMLQFGSQKSAMRTCQLRRGGPACGLEAVTMFYYLHEAKQAEAIAKDPPDPHFKTVAKPRPPHLPGLSALSRKFPHFAKLASRYAKIAGLEAAAATAENRASGAFIGSGENAADSRYTTMQRLAVERYAAAAMKLLKGQHALAVAAAREVKQRLGSAGAQLAKVLVSSRTQRADKLMAQALSGFGH